MACRWPVPAPACASPYLTLIRMMGVTCSWGATDGWWALGQGPTGESFFTLSKEEGNSSCLIARMTTYNECKILNTHSKTCPSQAQSKCSRTLCYYYFLHVLWDQGAGGSVISAFNFRINKQTVNALPHTVAYLDTCAYWTLEIWLVRIGMCCNVKYTQDLVWKNHVKYLNNFLYWLHVRLITFCICWVI